MLIRLVQTEIASGLCLFNICTNMLSAPSTICLELEEKETLALFIEYCETLFYPIESYSKFNIPKSYAWQHKSACFRFIWPLASQIYQWFLQNCTLYTKVMYIERILVWSLEIDLLLSTLYMIFLFNLTTSRAAMQKMEAQSQMIRGKKWKKLISWNPWIDPIESVALYTAIHLLGLDAPHSRG